ncbi:MAG TPA: hypothetical protein VK862_03225, partial [Afifellaceae bacterium]|nr:hypothetical protein [Afifellaceae bacterium]
MVVIDDTPFPFAARWNIVPVFVAQRSEMPDLVKRGLTQYIGEDRFHPIGPLQNASRIGDQVVAHLKETVRQPATGTMPVHRIVLQTAGIRFVVAHPQTRLGVKPPDQ